jgi:hypothetical protein
MSGEERVQVWRKRLESWSASGLNQKQWCLEHGVSLCQFGYWRKRLREIDDAGSGQTRMGAHAWCAMQVVDQSPRRGLEIHVGSACIAVEPGFDEGLLRSVVAALAPLRDAPC